MSRNKDEDRENALQNEIYNLEAKVIRVSPYIPKAAASTRAEDDVNNQDNHQNQHNSISVKEDEQQFMYEQLLKHLKKLDETHCQSRLEEDMKIKDLTRELKNKSEKEAAISKAFSELRNASANAKDISMKMFDEIEILEDEASKKLLEISEMRTTVLKLKLDGNRKKVKCSQETGDYVLGFEELKGQSQTIQKQTKDIENEISRLDNMHKSHIASISDTTEHKLPNAMKLLDEQKSLLVHVEKAMKQKQRKCNELKRTFEAKRATMADDRSQGNIQELESRYFDSLAEKKTLTEELESLKARYASLVV